jgi:hypothetical protein
VTASSLCQSDGVRLQVAGLGEHISPDARLLERQEPNEHRPNLPHFLGHLGAFLQAAVKLAAVPDPDHQNDQPGIFDGVGDSIVAGTEAPITRLAQTSAL